MATLVPSLMGLYMGAVPTQVNFRSPAGALTNQIIIPAAATQLIGNAAGQLFCSYLHCRAANACTLLVKDSGGVAQLSVDLGAGVEKEMAPSETGPLFGCDIGTGLQITTSVDPGTFEFTVVMRAIPTNMS